MKSTYFYIITGGPGVGKTALIEELNRQGFSTVPEDARRIIKEQIDLGGDGLPWKDKAHYAHLMYRAAIKNYQQAIQDNDSQVRFFDRGLLDTICYMRMEDIAIPASILDQIANYPYAHLVFILPPWQEIYHTDEERKQNWEEAEFTFQQMKETYLAFGYDVIELPKTSVSERATFILDHIAKHTNERRY
ncbi:AAA family ATPase [Sphingobacterium chungjuense]|uniref:AAA family ATPase n=1 Tax=Sphingobacterium chungjuense TaxID=2675553 RepID=UPI00140A0425|nr:AAA family ATPase [Sphingobacterium chungjuense]